MVSTSTKYLLLKKGSTQKNNCSSFTILTAEEKILLFHGTLDYKPNLDGVDAILKNINPFLLTNNNFKYKIIICGKGLPSVYNELKDFANKNIIYAGLCR